MQELGYAAVAAAAQVLDGVALRTPVLTSRQLDAQVGGQVFLDRKSVV